MISDGRGTLADHIFPGIFRRATVQIIPVDANLKLCLMANEVTSQLFGVVSDMASKALDDGDPDHVGRENERAVLAEGKMGGGEQRVKGDFLDTIRRIVAAS